MLATHHSTRRIQRNTHQEPRDVELEVSLEAVIYEVHGFALTALSWPALVRGVKDEAKTPEARYDRLAIGSTWAQRPPPILPRQVHRVVSDEKIHSTG